MPDKTLSGEFILQKDDTAPSVNPPQPDAPLSAEAKPETTSQTTPPVLSKNHEQSKSHFFSAFSKYPKNIHFKDQEADEEVVILVRQHMITNVPWITGVIALALLPPIISLLTPFFAPAYISAISPILITLSIVFYYLCVFTLGLLYYCIWYFNVGLITNKRIIDLDVHNILTRVISEARLNSVQDVTATMTGGIRSIFNYGDVDIQTEALRQTIEFSRVPRPNEIRVLVGNLVVHKK